MSLLKRLGLRYPIIQAPMAGVTTPALAAAVSNAGGLGSLGVAALDAETARKQIRAVRDATDKAFNVNLFVHQEPTPDAARDAGWIEHLRPEFEKFGASPPTALKSGYKSFLTYDDMVAVILEEKPPVVSFHFGLPPPAVVRDLKAAGCVLFASATSVDEARAGEAAGMDAIVAQGYEAGGHRGIFDPDGPDEKLPALELTRRVVAAVGVPVITAGGIMDGAGIRAALDAGAELAQLGTAFVTCTESATPAAHRAAFATDAANHTRITPAVSGRPARTLGTSWSAITAGLEEKGQLSKIAAYPNAYDIAKQLNALASSKGDTSYGAFWSGTGAPHVRPMPAAELVLTLAKELESA